MKPIRILAATGTVVGALLWATPAVHAVVHNGCTATGTASKSAGANITTDTVWHLHSDDVIGGVGDSPRPQKFVHVYAVFFGVDFRPSPIIDSNGDGSTHGTSNHFAVSDYSRYAREFAIAGSSSDCDGSILVIVDDVSALGTLSGQLSLALGILGLLGVVGAALRGHGIRGRISGALAGLILGLGSGEFLQQIGVLDPTSSRDLALPILSAVAGLLLADSLRRGAPQPPPPPAPAPGSAAPI